MTDLEPAAPSPAPSAPPAAAGPRLPPSAGALLRAARDAAGMSLDTVAQQLKLAPRQVIALETGDYAALPGRTFVRGFLRNYARLVRVDPEIVLAALAGREPPSLDSPALQATAPTIGELPTSEYAKPGWTRWVIPLTLVAVIAAAGIYEFSRSRGDARRGASATPGAGEPDRAATAEPAPAGSGAAPTPGPAAAQPAPQPAAAHSLPNPIAPPASSAAAAGPVPAEGTLATTPSPVAPAPADAVLVLVYRDGSWTEVKDGAGRLLVSQMVPAGQTRTVSGTPPFELVLGNAAAATVTFRGKAVDLAPHTRQKVARLVLQ